MKKVMDNSEVIFSYNLFLDNENSAGQDIHFAKFDRERPVKCKMDDENLISGIFDGLLSMGQGEKKKIFIEKERGFGDIKQELIRKCPIDILAGNAVEEGQFIQLKDENSKIVRAKVLEKKDEKVTLDLNHPLAGKDLTLEVEILYVQ